MPKMLNILELKGSLILASQKLPVCGVQLFVANGYVTVNKKTFADVPPDSPGERHILNVVSNMFGWSHNFRPD